MRSRINVQGKNRKFWRSLKERLSSAASAELSARAQQWHPTLCEETGFYGSRKSDSKERLASN
jgi:uncharacterized circularly permuted ATP-grasp superfamily protein